MAYLKESKKLVGAVPYGYDLVDGSCLVLNQDEQIVTGVMKQLRDEGSSYRKIASHLNAQGIPANRGGRWFSKTVRSTLKANLKSV